MKKVVIIILMVSLLAYAAPMVLGAGKTIVIPWFVNDPEGLLAYDWDTWFSVKNLTNNTVTLTVEYYDDSNWLATCDTVTVTLSPSVLYPVYTGDPAQSGKGENCDRGSAVIRWPDQGGSTQNQMQGLIQFLEATNMGALSGLNFDYK